MFVFEKILPAYFLFYFILFFIIFFYRLDRSDFAAQCALQAEEADDADKQPARLPEEGAVGEKSAPTLLQQNGFTQRFFETWELKE